jgi:GGDEF domain-containing protein/predicted transcriptional regulator
MRRFSRLKLPGRLFLNLNAVTMLQADFPSRFTRRFLHKLGLRPEQVVIELTEHLPVENYDALREVLAPYRRMGFSLALDDLGTAYAGLRVWSELRPEFIKFDKHFIHGINDDSFKKHFVDSLQNIAHGVGCQTIAEGIETRLEYQTVQSLGVNLGQGYYFARPAADPPREISPKLFFIHKCGEYRNNGVSQRSETISGLISVLPTVHSRMRLSAVGELLEKNPELWSIPVVDQDQPVGIVSRHTVMNVLAQMYGRDLHGRSPISEFMDTRPLVVDKMMPVEELSQIITESGHLARRQDFIITDEGRYLGAGTITDLLRKVTDLQIRNARYANPLTLLPGNVPISERIELLVETGRPFTVCYFDMDHFKAYNDFYSYDRGDMVIQLLGKILVNAADPEKDFVGHIGGDDFLVIFQSEDWRRRCEAVLECFAGEIPGFYDEEQRQAFGIATKDRREVDAFYPLISLSVGVVSLTHDTSYTPSEIAAMAAEAKKQAKKIPGNSLFQERRGFGGRQTIHSALGPETRLL